MENTNQNGRVSFDASERTIYNNNPMNEAEPTLPGASFPQQQPYYAGGGYVQQPAPPQQPPKNNTIKIVLITAVSVLLIVAAVIGVLFAVKSAKDDKDDTTTTQTAETTQAEEIAEVSTTAAPETTQTVPATTLPSTTAAPATAPPTTVAAPAGMANKVENPMRLRTGPGTGYRYTCVIPTGATVGVVSTQGDWAYVSYNGASGWVYGPLAFKSWWNGGSTPAASIYPYNATLKNNMKLRTGPGTSFGALRVIAKGSVVTVYEKQTNVAGSFGRALAITALRAGYA